MLRSSICSFSPRRQLGLGAAGVLGLALLLPSAAAAAPYDGYHDLDAVRQMVERHASSHRDRVQVETIGRSAGDRPIWLVTVAGDGPVDADARPGVFVGANVSGDHHAGTEAALHLLDTLLAPGPDHAETVAQLLRARTFYIAPVLNPDAHDALFGAVLQRRTANDWPMDVDLDGLLGEDGYDDLDGDGRITWLRIPDPDGGWLPHPDEPRLMVRADAERGWVGTHRVMREGDDNDGDGMHNEDPGIALMPDHNFPQAFPYGERAAGPWSGVAPEVKAVFDALFARRAIASAVVYGPGNNFLATPRPIASGGDLGSLTFRVPSRFAGFLGLDPEKDYTLDEIWAEVKDQPLVVQNNLTPNDVAQFLGAGPATKLEGDDGQRISTLAKAYKKRLEDAGLDVERAAEQYRKGGLTPWLYYQFGALAVELDVWGVPKPAPPASEDGEAAAGGDAPLTLARLEAMDAEAFGALSDDAITAFLQSIGAPPQFTAAGLRERIVSGQVTPAQMAQMARRMGASDDGAADGGGGAGGTASADDSPEIKRQREVLAWHDEHRPDAVSPWTPVTLRDGTRAEVGGSDPFASVAPPRAMLEPHLVVHTETVLDIAGQLPTVEMRSVTADALGRDVWRVRAIAANPDALPTHTDMAVRAKARRPVRLVLDVTDGISLITGQPAVTAETLAARVGTIEGEWVIRAAAGTTVRVTVDTETAGRATGTVTLTGGDR
ncbi:MAG: M14 family zinc carboxypeptidase [Acidobacteriota bacterium]